MQFTKSVRVALIHALEESVRPSRDSFVEHWPQAFNFDLLDTSLAIDLAFAGTIDDAIMQRFETLADYCRTSTGEAGLTQAILFTCSAFGPAIEAVKASSPIPVLRPNEAAFEAALELGDRIGLVVTYAPSLPALSAELTSMGAERGRRIRVSAVLAEGALDALKRGEEELHDQLAASACRQLTGIDAVVLGQFSLARAAGAIQAVVNAPVLTTPGCAVQKLRRLVESRRKSWHSVP